jgi:ketopantoate reductase
LLQGSPGSVPGKFPGDLAALMRTAYGDPVARVEEVCRLTAANVSSRYSDIKNGKQTEIDFINGALAREGAALGVPCPLNSAVTQIVHALESAR